MSRSVRIPEALLRKVIDNPGQAARLRAFLPSAKKAEVRKAKRDFRKKKTAAKVDAMTVLRAAVWERSGGKCEACGLPLVAERGELDHFFGGIGRRTEQQCVANCWRIDGACHRQKTANDPTREWWLQKFLIHLNRQEGRDEREQLDYALTREQLARLL